MGRNARGVPIFGLFSLACLIFEIAARCDTDRDEAYRNPIDTLRPISLYCASGDIDKRKLPQLLSMPAPFQLSKLDFNVYEAVKQKITSPGSR